MSKIEWCNITKDAKVVDGCSPKSPGCDHCWAAYDYGVGRQQGVPAVVEQHAADGTRCGVRPGTKRELVSIGKTRGGLLRGIYNGRVALNPARLAGALQKIPRNGGQRYPRDPVTGKADRSRPKEPNGNVVFWNSSSDTFHERLSFTEVAAQFAVMAARQDLRFLVLTKRPERASEILQYLRVMANQEDRCGIKSALLQAYRNAAGSDMPRRWAAQMPGVWPLPNVALGVSAEDQKRWNERVPVLLEMKECGDVARAFVSAEPMIGPITDPHGLYCSACGYTEQDQRLHADHRRCGNPSAWLDQVIVGAESGPGARPCKLEWIQGLAGAVVRAQGTCTACGGVGGWRERHGSDLLRAAWQECPRCLGEGSSGPRLFVKQADVCGACAGERIQWSPGRWSNAPCPECDGLGYAGKVRKMCPELHIPGPGAGTRSWAQRMEGF